jgi:hypothetical protein
MLVWKGCGAPERLSPEWRTILAGDRTFVVAIFWLRLARESPRRVQQT